MQGLHHRRRCCFAPAVALFACLLAPAHAAELWLFAGQSNMDPRTQFAAAQEAAGARGAQARLATAQRDGQAISYWAEGAAGWEAIRTAYAGLRPGEVPGAFAYYQGESDQRLFRGYERQLRDLIARVRGTSGRPDLPVLLAQLGPRYFTTQKAGAGAWWNMGFIREIQRRVALDLPHVHLIAAIDCSLRDTNVHLDRAAHREVGRRMGLALSGQPAGAIPERAWRDPGDPRAVLLRCVRVSGSLRLDEGWRDGMRLVAAAELPADFAAWPADLQPEQVLPPDALLVPEAAEVVAPDRVRLRFAAPVGRQARLNWAAQNGTNPLDVTDRGQPGFRGLSDATGIVAAAAALLPVLPDPP